MSQCELTRVIYTENTIITHNHTTMKANRFLSTLAILLIGSAVTANAEQLFADIQPEQRNDSVMTVNLYIEGDQLKDIKEQTAKYDFLKDSKFDEIGELTSVEIIYSNIAETHDAIAKRLSSGISALNLQPMVKTDDENSHIEIYFEPSDDPTSEMLKRLIVFVTDGNEVTAVILEGNFSMPDEMKKS